MLTKTDAGTYTYPPPGAARPHAVASVAKDGATTSFAYDADGNLLTESGATARTLTWKLFNMPLSIKYKTQTLTFQYDADHNRVMQKEGATDIVYYLPDGEWTVPLFGGNPPVWHTYFEVDGERVAEATNPNGTMIHNYFHNDYQNSIGMITDDTTIQPPKQDELSDVFGQPRLPTGAIDPTWGATDVSKRRYINQEDLTDAQLIDLNARVYDPLLAKFLSPDPIIADQDDSQSWNAYAYSRNNPMSKEDPTGLEDMKVFCEPGKCKKPEQGNPAAAISGGGAHFVGTIPSGQARLFARGAGGRPNNAAARTAAEVYGLTSSTTLVFSGSAAEDIAVALGCAIAEPCGATVLIGGGLIVVGGAAIIYNENNQATAVFSKPPSDAKDPTGAKAPGKPGEAEGFRDPKSGEKWGKAPNGKSGWVDDKGNVWVPTGQAGAPGTGTTGPAHGGPHWDVQDRSGGYRNVRPGGGS